MVGDLHAVGWLNIVEEGHETEVHVDLLVAVEEGEAGVVGDEIDLGFLIAADHDDIFDDAGGGLAGDLCEFEAVAVKVDGVDVVAGVAHADAVALALMEMKGWRGHHLMCGIGYAIDGPLIEAIECGVLFFEEHVEGFVGLRGGWVGIAEVGVVPLEGMGWEPLGLAFVACVLDYDAHAVVAVVVGEVAHDPDAGVVHLDDGGDALGGA